MSRVSMVEKGNAHPMVKELYEKNLQNNGRVLNLFKVLGHLPYIGLNFQRLGNSILKGEGLSPKLRELAILRVGFLTRCRYEIAQHTSVALRAGVNKKQIGEIGQWKLSLEFSSEEKAVLAYADEVEINIQVRDETFNGLRAFLNEPSIVELTAAITYYGMACRILEALKVDMESGSVDERGTPNYEY
jgi:4-carboxymuconolactone decarboxylase